MELSQFLSHPLFKKNVRTFGLGETLFKQGELGQTLYILLEGKVRLLAESRGRQYTIAIMGHGQFLGERALVADQPYERHFTAQAITPVLAVQMGQPELIELQTQAPHLMKLILTRSFQLAEERLNIANQLSRVLRIADPKKRLVHLIQYLAGTIGRQEPHGVRIGQLAEHIYFHIEMDKHLINEELKDLIARGLLKRDDEDEYLVPSVDVLIAVVEAQSDIAFTSQVRSIAR